MPPEALDTFPKILDWNAKNRADIASSREKEFGIWQSYTWSEQREEIRALALGLKSLGLNKGDRVSIVGSNRPRLYWAMVAIQSCENTQMNWDDLRFFLALARTGKLISAGAMLVLMGSNYLFKLCVALADTLPFYAGVHYLSRYLEMSEEELRAHAD